MIHVYSIVINTGRFFTIQYSSILSAVQRSVVYIQYGVVARKL